MFVTLWSSLHLLDHIELTLNKEAAAKRKQLQRKPIDLPQTTQKGFKIQKIGTFH